MEKRNRNFLIILLLLLLFFRYRRNTKGLKGGGAGNGTVNCGDYQCGGYNPTDMPLTCPDGCKCGQPDPMLPDAPRTCEPI